MVFSGGISLLRFWSLLWWGSKELEALRDFLPFVKISIKSALSSSFFSRGSSLIASASSMVMSLVIISFGSLGVLVVSISFLGGVVDSLDEFSGGVSEGILLNCKAMVVRWQVCYTKKTMKKMSLEAFVLGGYLLGVVGGGLFGGSLIISRDWLSIIGFFIGGVVGWVLVRLDRLVYVYWSHPDTQVAQYARYHFERKNWKAGFGLLEQRKQEMEELTFRSALFQVAWVVLALFALTSTAGLFGKAVVMGLGLKILFNELQDYMKDKALLKRWLFWQIKRPITDNEVKWYMNIMTVVFIGLTLLLV